MPLGPGHLMQGQEDTRIFQDWLPARIARYRPTVHEGPPQERDWSFHLLRPPYNATTKLSNWSHLWRPRW